MKRHFISTWFSPVISDIMDLLIVECFGHNVVAGGTMDVLDFYGCIFMIFARNSSSINSSVMRCTYMIRGAHT